MKNQAKKPNKPKSKKTNIKKTKVITPKVFYKNPKTILFIVAFAAIGAIFTYLSFAATGSIKSVPISVEAAEGSGMIASRQYPGVYWWHRDGGEATDQKPRDAIYAVKFDSNGNPVPVRGTKYFPFNLVSGSKNNNWEDIAMDDQNNIWIGDIGANLCGRNDQKIMKIKEPNPTSDEGLTILASYTFKFPDPASGCNTWNSEAMFWLDGKMYIFAKTSNSPVYRIDLPAGSNSGTAKLVRIGTLAGGVSNISASSITDDRSRLMVASHGSTNIYQTTNTSLTGDALVKDLISRTPKYKASFTCGSGCTLAVEGGSFKRNSYDIAYVSENKYLYYGKPADYGDTTNIAPTPTPTPPPTTTPTSSAPTVTLTGLANNETFSGTKTFTVNATDSDGIKSVVMRIDDKYVATDQTNPYNFSIDTTKYSKGVHTITIRAYDTKENMTEKTRQVTFQ
jgi:hypothetical protein